MGDGRRQTRCYPPDYWKTFLSVAQKEMWREKGSLALIQTIIASFWGALGLPPLHLPRCALERCSTQIRHQYSKCGHGSFGSHKKMMLWSPLFFIFLTFNADFIVGTKGHLIWLDYSQSTRQDGSISTTPNSIDFLKKSFLPYLDSTSEDSHPKTVCQLYMNESSQ